MADENIIYAKKIANDFTTAEKNKLAGIESGAEVNVIETVKKNGTALTITNKAVDISVPTASSTSPKMDGTAAVGTESTFARGDHVHPTDTSRASSSHTHGNITNAGALQTTDISIASGDKLVVTDSSNSNKIARTSLSFDGSTTSQALSKKGTFETFLTSHQSLSAYAKLASPTFTGTPKAPTAATGTNTTQIATTAFVQAEYATQPNTTTNLAVYTSGRCTRKAGGYRQIGKRVDVDIQITINTTLGANDYWQLIKGFPTPARESALAVCVVGKGAAYSGWISNAGAVTIACGPTNLVSGNVVSFTGTYYTS